jgi:hypothetical protein
MLGIGLGLNKLRSSGLANYLAGAMVWGFRSKFKWSQTSTDIWGFANPNDIDPEAQAVYDRIIADGGVSNLTRLNYFVVGLKTIYGTLANVPVCYDAHWIGYKLGSGTGATAGQAAAKLYSLTVAGDAVQATAASQPLLLAHNGASSDNYWYGSGVSGNYVATASQSALKFNTDFSVVVNLESYQASTTMELAGSSGGWAAFSIGFSGLLAFDFGGVRFTSTSAISGSTNWIRYSASGTSLFFYTSIDGSTWTQLGTTVTMSARTTPSNIEIFAGKGNANIANPLNGKIKSIKYYTDSALASLIYNFNPATYNASTSQTAWTSATGEVWTISTGTAATGYKGVLVDRTIVQGDGVDDSMLSGTVSISSATNFLAVNPLNLNAAKYFIGSSVADVNILYYTPSSVRYGNTTPYLEFSFTAVIQNRLALFTAVKNGVSSLVEYNNANQVTGSVGVASITSIKLFSPSTSSLLGNINLNSLVISGSADNLTTRTATYNLIRSLNNNAF